MWTGEDLKLSPRKSQCLSSMHHVLRISRYPASSFSSHSEISPVHAVSLHMHKQPQSCRAVHCLGRLTQSSMLHKVQIVLWDVCHVGRWAAWSQGDQERLNCSLCTVVWKKDVSVGWSECLVTYPHTTPHCGNPSVEWVGRSRLPHSSFLLS